MMYIWALWRCFWCSSCEQASIRILPGLKRDIDRLFTDANEGQQVLAHFYRVTHMLL